MGTPMLNRCKQLFFRLTGSLWLTLWALAATAANDHGLFFELRHGDAVVHLLGSAHLAASDIYPLRDVIIDAYDAADVLVVEVDIRAVDPQRLEKWVSTYGLYSHGESLRDHLQPVTWQRLQAHLQSNGLNAAMLQRYKPGLLITTLSTLALQAGGLSPALGIDAFFLERAHREGRTIVELESLESQLDLLAGLPEPDLLINRTLDEIAQLPTLTDRLFDAWRRGDTERLAKVLLQDNLQKHPGYRQMYERIYTMRNHAMTQRIRDLMADGKRYFVVVGAAHLVGDDGIVALLREAGYRVDQH